MDEDESGSIIAATSKDDEFKLQSLQLGELTRSL